MFTNSELSSNSQNILIDQCKASFSLLRIIGLLPVRISSAGKVSYKVKSFASLYSLVVYVVGAYSALLQIMEEYKTLSLSTHSFNHILYSVALIISFSAWLVIPLLFWLNIYKLICFINLWNLFQETYYEYTKCKLSINIKKRVNITSIVTVCWCLFSWIGLITNGGSPNLILAINLLIWIISINFISLFWAMLCLILKEASVNLSMFNMQSICSQFNTSENVKKSEKLWLMLRSLIMALEEAFKMFWFFYCPVIFFMASVMAFQFVLHIYLPEYDNNKASSAGIVYYAILTFLTVVVISIVVYHAHLVSHEAGLKFRRSIIMGVNLNSINFDTQNQVFNLLNIFEYGDPVITICGFTKLSPPFLTSMLAASIGYIVIMLQFSVAL